MESLKEFEPSQETPQKETSPKAKPLEWEHYGEHEIDFTEKGTKFIHRKTGEEVPGAKKEEEPKNPYDQLTEKEKERVEEKMKDYQPDSEKLRGYASTKIFEVIDGKRRQFSEEELAQRGKDKESQG